MKKYLLLLLFIPLMSFGQIVTYETMDDMGVRTTHEVDVRDFNDKYITVALNQILPRCHVVSTSEYKNLIMRTAPRQKVWNTFDEGVKIRLTDKVDVLNFFSKYGYELASSDSETYGIISRNMVIPASDETLTLIKVNQ
ncbi:MAG: hypothetical protein ISR04_02050 [Flavobacteriaceae bacterium]|nr:hypothetical protein [Flavobacteriaceae bacterium]